jgi:hypothetical protein
MPDKEKAPSSIAPIPSTTRNDQFSNDGDPDDSEPEKTEEESETPGGEDYELPEIVSKGYRDSGWKKYHIQSISRQTLTVTDLKEVPASFGDSINALTALPGIIRTSGGIFGPLVIRGADTATNNYFIDDIPIHDPLHFGGLHSVINTNFMKDIDVYASAFPAAFNSATSAVINISTVNEVDEFQGIADLNFLSISTLMKTPILISTPGVLRIGEPSNGARNHESDSENAGYVIASGRYGFITLAAKAAELVSGEEPDAIPEYWDYQFKARYDLSTKNALTLLLFGQSDIFNNDLDDDQLDEGDDPLFEDSQFDSDVSSNSQGLYFDSTISDTFNNRLLAYSNFRDTHSYLNFNAESAASWAKDIGANYRSWILGVKDKFTKDYLSGHARLRGALEYTYYHFDAKGKALLPTGAWDEFDPSDESLFNAYTLDDSIENHLYGAYLESEFTFRELTITPGIRSEYLARMQQATFDPRLMVSYRLGDDLMLSAAGGHYSYFFQTNPVYFNTNPDLTRIDHRIAEPEQAWHLSVSAQKAVALYTIKAEAFSNDYYNKPEPYPHYEADGTYLQGLCTGKLKTRGIELMIRKDSLGDREGSFGWISYTYTRSKGKTGLPTTDGYAGVAENLAGDEYGDVWTPSDYEQRHNVKLTGGYRLGNHIFSGRLQYYSGFPYTPYIAGIYDTNYNDLTGENRYYPVTGTRNSERFPDFFTIDFRYTHKKTRSWGELSWYVEMINVLMQKPKDTQKWYYDRPYGVGSNPVITDDDGLPFLLSFGVEMKF